jgi:hypothetical protein
MGKRRARSNAMKIATTPRPAPTTAVQSVHVVPEQAVLPYAGTSGHSGTDTSRDRALDADASGKTRDRQNALRGLLRMHQSRGITVKELREQTGWHHGVASSALTNLHIAGDIERLVEKRDRCHVYVLPQYDAGRPTEAYVSRASKVPDHCPHCGGAL